MAQKSKTAATKLEPEHVVRCGDVAASIYLRQSNTGHVYRDFELSRKWSSMASGKECRAATFFDVNESDLADAVRAASEWIRSKRRDDVLPATDSNDHEVSTQQDVHETDAVLSPAN